VNRVILSGPVDSDPEIRTTTTNNKTVGSFRIDTGKGWFTITAWEDLAKDMPPKGTYVLVDGRLSTRSYDKDGTKVYVTEVVASTIEVVGAVAAEAPDDDLGF